MTAGRLLVTSIVRHARIERTSGYARVVERATGRVPMRSPMQEAVHRARDENPRGGLRGARGVATFGDRVLIANAERVLLFDRSWAMVGEITHPLMGGVHDLLPEEDGLWITSTSADLLLRIGWDGSLRDVWEWRHDPGLRAAFGFGALPEVDRSIDFRDPDSLRGYVGDLVHMNAVARGTGGLLLSFGRVQSPAAYRRQRVASAIGRVASSLGIRRASSPVVPAKGPAVPVDRIVEGSSAAIVRVAVDAGGEAAVLHHVREASVPNHDVLEVGGDLVYNDSNGARLVAARPGAEQAHRAVPIPGSPSFPRGLASLGGPEFVTGSQQPLALYHVDLEDQRIVRTYALDGEPRETCYGICVLPDHFDDPPPRLAFH